MRYKQGTSNTPERSWLWLLAPPATGAHRGHNPLDSSRRQLLTLGLFHQCHAQVLEAEEHPLKQCLPSVCPVLRQLWAGRGQALRPNTATALTSPICKGDPARDTGVLPSTIIFIVNKGLTFSSTYQAPQYEASHKIMSLILMRTYEVDTLSYPFTKTLRPREAKSHNQVQRTSKYKSQDSNPYHQVQTPNSASMLTLAEHKPCNFLTESPMQSREVVLSPL